MAYNLPCNLTYVQVKWKLGFLYFWLEPSTLGISCKNLTCLEQEASPLLTQETSNFLVMGLTTLMIQSLTSPLSVLSSMPQVPGPKSAMLWTRSASLWHNLSLLTGQLLNISYVICMVLWTLACFCLQLRLLHLSVCTYTMILTGLQTLMIGGPPLVPAFFLVPTLFLGGPRNKLLLLVQCWSLISLLSTCCLCSSLDSITVAWTSVQDANTSHLLWQSEYSCSLTHNSVLHSQTKHMELDIFFVRKKVINKSLLVTHVPATEEIADVLTKPLANSQLLSAFTPSLRAKCWCI